MEQQLTAVGKYNAIENAVFFKDGSTHMFRGERLTRLTVEMRYREIQRWAKFKGFVSADEEIIVPGFFHETLENNND